MTRSFVMVPMLRGCVARRCVQLLAWRFAPHNHAEQADIGRQSLRLFRPRGLSAAPLCVKTMETPECMKAELAAWNNGEGIDLESWVGCEGNFSLAIGYATVFWPEFVEFEDYILRKDFSETSLRGFESQEGCSKKSTEWVMNHLHIADIQHYGCKDISKDKLILLGKLLKEIYETKLSAQFPHKPCIVEFYKPEDDEENLIEYQISFWQSKHE